MEWVDILSVFGFPAFMVVFVFVAYKELVKQLVEVVRANTESARALAESHRVLCDRVQALEGVVARTVDGGRG